MFVSQPHFYLADPYYSSLVHGMRPNPEKHTTSLKIEPLSGVPVEVLAKFQLNVLIDKVNFLEFIIIFPTLRQMFRNFVVLSAKTNPLLNLILSTLNWILKDISLMLNI